MRDWQRAATGPMTLVLAADARHFHTDYADDQIWQLEIGQEQSPALVLQTRYGGRCGLARLVPMWVVDGRVIYEAASYAEQPTLTTFWPSYLKLRARPASQLGLVAEYWAIESHVTGGRFTFLNEGQKVTQVNVDLFAQTMTANKDGEVSVLTLSDGQKALHLHDVGNIHPVILMEGDDPGPSGTGHQSPKITSSLTIPPGEQASVRWVHAARHVRSESLQSAHYWLHDEDWDAHLARLEAINASTPDIETGDPDRDAAIAFSYKVALGSFVGPTANMPYTSFVSARMPGHGFSPRGDGSDHNRLWSGQTAAQAYVMLPAVATAAPELAKGVLRNFLAVSSADGFIDWKPGLGGQRDGALSIPLLATTAWEIFSYAEDHDFLGDVFSGLTRFFHRWFAADVDRDEDGLPEWADTTQSGFSEHPSFVPYRRWAQNADISKAETPDLVAYLIREARSLLLMANTLGETEAAAVIQERLDTLLEQLKTMWNAATGSYHYRDRDTHVTSTGGFVAEGDADEVLLPVMELDPPNRLILRVLGGRDHRPNATITFEGLDVHGEPIEETVSSQGLVWYRGMGTLTTDGVYSRIDRIVAEDLSRVYKLQVSSVDLTRQDQTLLLPLWAGLDDEGRLEALIETVTDPDRYWRPHGISICSTQDSAYDPANQNGSGGVWMPWNLMLGEGLIAAGRPELAAELLDRLMRAQLHHLRTEKAFQEGYNSDTLDGLGEPGHVSGIVPLHLLWELMGFRVITGRKVWIGGVYRLPWPVIVRHLGVTIERDAKGAKITFPSGHQKRVRSEKWRAIEDPTVGAESVSPPAPIEASLPPSPPQVPDNLPAKTVSVPISVGGTETPGDAVDDSGAP